MTANKDIYRLSNFTAYRQLFILIITGIFDLVFFAVYWFYGFVNLYLLMAIIIIQSFFYLANFLLYDISFNEGNLYVSNLFKKEQIIPGTEYEVIKKLNLLYIFLMLPSPPFYRIHFKYGRKFIFLSSSINAYLSFFTFGLNDHCRKLNEVVKEKIFSKGK